MSPTWFDLRPTDGVYTKESLKKFAVDVMKSTRYDNKIEGDTFFNV